MLLLALLACSDGSKDDSPLDDTGGGGGGCVHPTATILEPISGAQYMLGTSVPLRGEVESVDELASVKILWGIDDDVVGNGLEEDWIADAPGSRLVRLQATDSCGTAAASVTITISEVGG